MFVNLNIQNAWSLRYAGYRNASRLDIYGKPYGTWHIKYNPIHEWHIIDFELFLVQFMDGVGHEGQIDV